MSKIVFPSGYAAKKGWRTKLEPLRGVKIFSNYIEVEDLSDINAMFLAEVVLDSQTKPSPEIQSWINQSFSLFGRNYLLNTAVEPVQMETFQGIAEDITIKPHQLAGVESILRMRKGWLGDDLGAGKTLMSLAAAIEGDQLPCLAVVKPTTSGKWQKEQQKFFPNHTSVILQGETPYDVEPHNFYIIGYSVLPHWQKQLATMGIKSFVFDEAHKLCDFKTQQSKAAKALTKDADEENIILLITTTPLKKGPFQMWQHLNILDIVKEFGGNYNKFGDLFCDRQKKYGRWDMSGTTNPQHLHDLIMSKRMVRRLKHSYLPPEVANNCGVEQMDFICYLSNEDYDEYLKLKDKSDEEVVDLLSKYLECDPELVPEHEKSKIISKVLGRKKFMLKLGRGEFGKQKNDKGEFEENHAKFTKTHMLGQFLNAKKLTYILDWLEDFNEEQPDDKIIVFARSRDMQRALAGKPLDEKQVREFPFPKKELTRAKKLAEKMGAETIFAVQDQGIEGIDESIERFQTDPSCRMIVVSMGNVESHTLTAAWYILWADLPYNRSDEAQGEGRAAGRVNDPHGAFSWRTVVCGPNGEETVDHNLVSNIAESAIATSAILDGKIEKNG